ncbi:muconate/chloromuconate family cycloisomerase [soil metagenome]
MTAGVGIERVETVPYSLPFARPYVTAHGTLHEREMVLLRLRTGTEGLEGLGEAVPMSLRGDSSLTAVTASIDDAAARLAGLDLAPAREDPLAFAIATVVEMTGSRSLGAAGRAAIECAVFDLAAKVAEEPLWRLLGATNVEPLEVNATLGADTPDALAAEAADWADAGFETFKLKLGHGDDVEIVRAVRDAVGLATRIRLDANEAWKPREAAVILNELEPLAIELCEQPVAGLRGLARVAKDTTVPIAADESVTSEADAHRAVQRHACAFATAKLSKVGGIGAARQIARVLPTYMSSALDGPVGIAAAAHAAQVVIADGNDPGVAHGLATQRLFAESIAVRECRIETGKLHLPDGPGLGVELDEDALARRALPRE